MLFLLVLFIAHKLIYSEREEEKWLCFSFLFSFLFEVVYLSFRICMGISHREERGKHGAEVNKSIQALM